MTLHRAPADIEAFMVRYRETHLRLAANIPGLVRTELIPATRPGADGDFLCAELYFTDEGFAAALTSPELAVFAQALITLGVCGAISA